MEPEVCPHGYDALLCFKCIIGDPADKDCVTLPDGSCVGDCQLHHNHVFTDGWVRDNQVFRACRCGIYDNPNVRESDFPTKE